MSKQSSHKVDARLPRVRSDVPFYTCVTALCTMYLVLIGVMLLAMGAYTTPSHL